MPSLVFVALFLSLRLFFLETLMARGDGGEGMLLGTSPKQVLGASIQGNVIADLTHH